MTWVGVNEKGLRVGHGGFDELEGLQIQAGLQGAILRSLVAKGDEDMAAWMRENLRKSLAEMEVLEKVMEKGLAA